MKMAYEILISTRQAHTRSVCVCESVFIASAYKIQAQMHTITLHVMCGKIHGQFELVGVFFCWLLSAFRIPKKKGNKPTIHCTHTLQIMKKNKKRNVFLS